jgi:hypothetical protein
MDNVCEFCYGDRNSFGCTGCEFVNCNSFGCDSWTSRGSLYCSDCSKYKCACGAPRGLDGVCDDCELTASIRRWERQCRFNRMGCSNNTSVKDSSM